MIRILQCVNDMHRAGLETMLMNYYRNTDKSKVQFDFLTHRPNPSDYDEEILSLGGRVYYAPRLYPQNYPEYFKWTRQFFYEHPEYKIVHSHIDSMSYLPLLAAKRSGVPYRIAHSHNTSIDMDYKYPLKQYFRHKITSVANIYLACGEEAGKYLFGRNAFKVIPNAVEAKSFYFNKCIRDKIRNQLGISCERFVIGHVGRFTHQKNHKFLLEVFKSVLSKRPDAVLLLIGTGEKVDEVNYLIRKYNLTKNVMMLGNRADVDELYQAMDVFVLPSLYEGIPVVGIEAQFSGLPCIFSDRVPLETKFTSTCDFLSLNLSPEDWANYIIKKINQNRGSQTKEIINSKYDIENSKYILQDLYLSLVK